MMKSFGLSLALVVVGLAGCDAVLGYGKVRIDERPEQEAGAGASPTTETVDDDDDTATPTSPVLSGGGGAGAGPALGGGGAGGEEPPLLDNGAPCSINAECSSQRCVDGVCCDSACNRVCESCRSVHTGSQDGRCAAIREGDDPFNQCDADINGRCHGAACAGIRNQCAPAPAGTVCRPAPPLSQCDVTDRCDGTERSCSSLDNDGDECVGEQNGTPVPGCCNGPLCVLSIGGPVQCSPS
ncbi:MAG: hypothetical protein AAGA56_26945 [Myxococcota bacterium]